MALWESEDQDAKVRYSASQLKHLLELASKGNADEVTADLVELVESGNAKSVFEAHDIRQKERQKEKWENLRAEKRAERQAAPMPERKYEVVLADPPWKYGFSKNENRRVENHYPTMTLEEIKAVDVPSEDYSILFLWSPSPKLTEALEVMEGWGYQYKTSMVWVKDKIGKGYYTRGKHEFLLIGNKGKHPIPEESDRFPSVIEAPRTEHSAKPHEVYEIIENLYPVASKVELFARGIPRLGWTFWGNEILETSVEEVA